LKAKPGRRICLHDIITGVDVVVSVTSAPNHIIKAETLRYLPKNKRLLIIDAFSPDAMNKVFESTPALKNISLKLSTTSSCASE